MKKELKAVCGLVLAIAAVISAGRASAEISIGIEPVAYSVRPAAWGQVSRPSSTDRLSEAAESLAEAAGSGDNAKAETLLASLYSGAARKEAAAPVYASAKQAAPAPVVTAPVKSAAPARTKRAVVTKSAFEALEEAAGNSVSKEADVKAKKEKKEDEGISIEESLAQAAADYDADFGAGSLAKKEAPKQTLLQDLLGGGIGMMIVILLILLL